MTDDRESRAALDDILAHGRRTRTPVSRGVWIAALVVGVVCAIGFAVLLLAEPSAEGPRAPARTASSGGGGLGIGLVIGACAGIVIGFAISRQRADHSSRNKP